MRRNQDKDEIRSLINILEYETKDLVKGNFSVYENFIREFTIFIKLLFERLKQSESNCLENCRTELNYSVTSFGTDEFTHEYKEWAETLASIDEAMGRNYNPNMYKNPLVTFRNMYENFYYLIGGNLNNRAHMELFAELTKRCLGRIGFDHVKTNYFMGAIIFEIDNCSRIVKGMDALYREQLRYRELHPGTLIITDEYTIKNFVGKYLENWFQNQGNNLNNDTSSMTLK